MYTHYESTQHMISFQLNGLPDSKITQLVYSFLKFEDIRKHLQNSFKLPFTKLRIFTQEGVEIYREDVEFIKDREIYYVSDGEEFDQSSSFSIYQIIQLLGEGGFGKVLLGKHKITQELVAIKIIDTFKIGNAVDIDMVFREAELLKSLCHKNIVQIYNCYTLANMQVVIIMEYVSGGELLQYIEENGRLSEEEARYFFFQIAEAISYCHSQKLIHRDLKLENILISEDKVIKLVDFGISGMASNFNADKLDVGSLGYMAPEVLSGQAKRLGPPIDIWSLGVILYGLVCGILPFSKMSSIHTIQSIIEGRFSFPSYINLSKECYDLITKMLCTDDKQRIKLNQILAHPWLKVMPKYANESFSQTKKNIFKKENNKVTFKIQKRENTRIIINPQKSKSKFSDQKDSSDTPIAISHFENAESLQESQSPMLPQMQTSQVQSLSPPISRKPIKHQHERLITKDYNQVLKKFKKIQRCNLNFKIKAEQKIIIRKPRELNHLSLIIDPSNEMKKKKFQPNSSYDRTIQKKKIVQFYTQERINEQPGSQTMWHEFNYQPWHEKLKTQNPQFQHELQLQFLKTKRNKNLQSVKNFLSFFKWNSIKN